MGTLEAAWGKAPWVSHEGRPIFSVDVHPGGELFATGGGDGLVKLWHLEALFAPAPSAGANALRATLDAHTGAVNVVRFSASANPILASGSDDHVIMLWRRAPDGAPPAAPAFGAAPRPPDAEPWQCVAALRGHRSDVTDVAWAPSGKLLASASLDSTVRVWAVSRLTGGPARPAADPDRRGAADGTGPVQTAAVATLSEHTGMVKGVAWDPTGRYLASQADDRSVLVYARPSYHVLTRITEPFRGSTTRTFARRLSFSPDGQFLGAPHAYAQPAHVGAVLQRPRAHDDEWRMQYQFKGHRSPVSVMRFSPKLYGYPRYPSGYPSGSAAAEGGGEGEGGEAQRQALCACAVGSQDNTFSIWLTSHPRPILVCADVFSSAVNDAAWAGDGLTCLFASVDGSVSHVRLVERTCDFDVLPTGTVAAHLRAMYGAPADVDEAGEELPLAEAVSQMADEAAGRALAAADGAARAGGRAAEGSRPPGQLEQRTASGKRRITPQPLGESPSQSQLPTAAAAARAPGTAAGGRAAADAAGAPTDPTAAPEAKRARSAAAAAELLLAPATGRGASYASPLTPLSAARGLVECSFTLAPEADSVAAGGADAAQSSAEPGARTWAVQARATPDGQSAVRAVAGGAERWSARVGGSVVAIAGCAHFVALACADCTLHVLSARSGARRLPPLLLGARAVALRVDARAAALLALTADGELRVWALHAGAASAPAASALPAPYLGPYLAHRSSVLPVLATTAAPVVSVVCTAPPGTARAALAAEGGPAAAAPPLAEPGPPLLLLENGRAFLYSDALEGWLALAEPCERSEYWSSLPELAISEISEIAISEGAAGVEEGLRGGAEPLRALYEAGRAAASEEGGADGAGATANPPLSGGLDEATQRTENLRHLEGALCSAAALGSVAEYAVWARSYALCLAQLGDERRARELCEGLVGRAVAPAAEEEAGTQPPACATAAVWTPVQARALLEATVLPALATNRALQRLVQHFRAALPVL